MKVPASEWPFHVFTQSMHQEVAPWDRPIVPLPCGHLPQGLCDDCTWCIWYMGMDQCHWGQTEDMMTDEDIAHYEARWSDTYTCVCFTPRVSGYDTRWARHATYRYAQKCTNRNCNHVVMPTFVIASGFRFCCKGCESAYAASSEK